jgi:hypothetical protein
MVWLQGEQKITQTDHKPTTALQDVSDYWDNGYRLHNKETLQPTDTVSQMDMTEFSTRQQHSIHSSQHPMEPFPKQIIF